MDLKKIGSVSLGLKICTVVCEMISFARNYYSGYKI